MSSKFAVSVAILLSSALTLGSALGAQNAELGAECVGTEAPKNIATCPGGPSNFEANPQKGVAFKSAPPPRETRGPQDVKPPNPDELSKYAERDTRKTRLQARARQLLTTEIMGLERLYARTSKKSPDRSQLTRRLAEGYVELESAANRDKLEAEIKAQDAKAKKQAATATSLRRDAAAATKIVKAARANAIKYYTRMKDEFPNYSKIDEVLYYLAYEHEQAGDYQSARQVYLELIQKAPKSPHIPNAYLAFGELFFQEAQGDPSKWDLAAAAYEEVTKYPPPTNKLYGYARYKLAYVHWNKGAYPQALNEFKKVIDYGDTYKDLPNAPQLARAARRDLIPVYAASGAPDKAYNFFKPLSGDKGGDDTKTIGMLNELGLAYLDTGHYREGITLYKDLMSRDPGVKTCYYQGQITSATQAIFSGDKDTVRKELDNQLRVRNDYVGGGAPDKEKLACSNRTAELLAETAMSWHLEAVGSGGVRGTGDKKTMDLAAYLYKKVTDTFTAADFAKFEFPRIMKEDWPTLYKLRYLAADLLYFQQRWEECGPAFDAVVAEDPKAAEATQAAYAAVLCYQKMYDKMYAGDADKKGKGLGPTGDEKEQEAKKGEWERLKPKTLTDMQKGMLQAFNRYVCYIRPPKGDKEAEEQYVDVKFARARTYFEAQHWEEAAIAFRDIAMNYPSNDAGLFAAQFYLESLNVLGSRAEPPRTACFDEMATDVPAFLDLYCKGSKFEDNKENCEILTRIRFNIRRLKAQKTIEVADSQTDKGQTKEALDNYRSGADQYLDLWRTYCEGPLSSGEKPKQCEKADEIIHNMARGYQAARLLAKAIQARQILLNPKYGLHESPLAMRATYDIGQNYQAIAVYDRAAEWYDKYAKATNYRGEFADRALNDVVLLRLGLGQEDLAIEAADNFNRHFGARKAEQAAAISFNVAAHYGEKKDWGNVEKRLGGAMRLIDTKATLDVRLQAHALLGRAYTQARKAQTPKASREYGTVVKLWSDPKAAVSEIEKLEEDPASKLRRMGRALEAVGEAMFYFAELKKEKVDSVEFPVYKGAGSKEAVIKHIQTKVKDWISKKAPLIKEASEEYKKVVDLQPVPPPRWVIAAGSRTGEMWGTFVKEFRAAPIPDSIKKDYELRTAYYGGLDEASEPQKLIAKSAYGVCLDYSVKYQYFDEFSRACEEWLATNYKSEYHLIDEFRGAPTRVNSVLKEQGNPLRIGGAPIAAVLNESPAKKPASPADEEAATK